MRSGGGGSAFNSLNLGTAGGGVVRIAAGISTHRVIRPVIVSALLVSGDSRAANADYAGHVAGREPHRDVHQLPGQAVELVVSAVVVSGSL